MTLQESSASPFITPHPNPSSFFRLLSSYVPSIASDSIAFASFYGSHVYGVARKDSDFDIFVVLMEGVPLPKIDEHGASDNTEGQKFNHLAISLQWSSGEDDNPVPLDVTVNSYEDVMNGFTHLYSLFISFFRSASKLCDIIRSYLRS